MVGSAYDSSCRCRIVFLRQKQKQEFLSIFVLLKVRWGILVNELVQIGFFLTIAGIAIVMMASLLLASQARKGEGRVQGGGAVLIGPIPIVWGTDKSWVFVAIILLLVIMLLSFVSGRL